MIKENMPLGEELEKNVELSIAVLRHKARVVFFSNTTNNNLCFNQYGYYLKDLNNLLKDQVKYKSIKQTALLCNFRIVLVLDLHDTVIHEYSYIFCCAKRRYNFMY